MTHVDTKQKQPLHWPTLAGVTAGLGVASFTATTALTGSLSSYVGGAGDVLFTLADLCLTPFKGAEAGAMGDMESHGVHQGMLILGVGGTLGALFAPDLRRMGVFGERRFDDGPVLEAMCRMAHLAGVPPQVLEVLFREIFAREVDGDRLLATYHDPQLLDGPVGNLRRCRAAERHMTMVAALRVASHFGEMTDGVVGEVERLADRLGMEEDEVRRIFTRLMGLPTEPGPAPWQIAAKKTAKFSAAAARTGARFGAIAALATARGLRQGVATGYPILRAYALQLVRATPVTPPRQSRPFPEA